MNGERGLAPPQYGTDESDYQALHLPGDHPSVAGLAFQKAQKSVATGACIEVAAVEHGVHPDVATLGGVAIRDSKNPDRVMVVPAKEFEALIKAASSGTLDFLLNKNTPPVEE